jgi:hypothetical protein
VWEGEGIDGNAAELGESMTWWFYGVRRWLPNVQVQVGTGICLTVLPSTAYASSFHFAVSFSTDYNLLVYSETKLQLTSHPMHE